MHCSVVIFADKLGFISLNSRMKILRLLCDECKVTIIMEVRWCVIGEQCKIT